MPSVLTGLGPVVMINIEFGRNYRLLVKICVAVKEILAFFLGQVPIRPSKIVKFEISDQTLVGELVKPMASVSN
jgi:hypothetical protein